MPLRRLVATAIASVVASFVASRAAADPPQASAPVASTEVDRERGEAAMADAARAFLAALDDAQRAKAVRRFDDPARTTWSYVRASGTGALLADLSADARTKALALAASALSAQGMTKLERVRAIEAERRAGDVARGDKELPFGPDLYEVMVFGTPGERPWGFRFEGHHIGLHFSSVSGETTTTPLFFGSFPAALATGADRGTRPLGAEQDAALALRRALSAEQAKRATIADGPPADVITGPGHERALHEGAPSAGIAMADLAQPERDALWALVVRHAADLRGDLASDELRRIKAAGTEAIHFAFAGEPALDKPHYYRITGPTFAIEFDCTQGNPDHVHCLWTDPKRNFGGDPLGDHVRGEHAPSATSGSQTR